MVSAIGLLVVVGATLALSGGLFDENPQPAANTASATSTPIPGTASTSTPPTTSDLEPTSSSADLPLETQVPPTVPTSNPEPTEALVQEVSDEHPELPPLEVGQPAFTYPLNELGNIEKWFGESYQFDNISVAWPPGAFPPERAEVVAQKTRDALAEANQKLGTDFSGPIEIYLADQLFSEDCLGCQGFTAADLYMIFMLQDGSINEAQFDALLVHEMTHLIAAHYIGLPHELFYAEGLAMWVMSEDIVNYGGVSPVQVTAWMYREGSLPSIAELFDDDYAGRVRKRVPYDAAGAFAKFVIETYGFDAYSRLYTLDPPEKVLGKDWATLEAEWHAWLEPLADQEFNGVNSSQWWAAASQNIQGYYRLYEDPSTVSPDQYRELSYSRTALNMAEVELALEHLQASGLVGQTAQ
jgi:hypothetical protein